MLILDGKTHTVPDVYGIIKVTNIGSVALPNFNVALLIGEQLHGVPFNAPAPDNGGTVIRGYSNIQALKKDYGAGTDMVQAFRYAKKAGAGVVFVLGVNPLTQASATLVDGTATPSVDLKSNMWGAT